MRSAPFGFTGVPVAVIGQGTWMVEGAPAAEERAVEALRAGLDLGLTHVDTAEMYGSGRAEDARGPGSRGAARRCLPGEQGAALQCFV